jgi:hypothetical protein
MKDNVSDPFTQEVIIGAHNVALVARHFIGTPFDCEITRFEKVEAPLTKLIHQNEDGTFSNDSSRCKMVKGTAQRVPVFGLHGLFEILSASIPPNVAFALGELRPSLPGRVTIAARKSLDRYPGAVTRSRANFTYRPRAGFVLIDYDTKHMPAAIKQKIDLAGGFPNALEAVCPEFGKAGSIMRPSTSAGIYNPASGHRSQGGTGLHIYVWVRDVSDAKRFLYALHDRLWLAGYGWIWPGRAGQGLSRSPIDKSVFAPEHLAFEADPELKPSPKWGELAQEPRPPLVHEGWLLDTCAAFPPLEPPQSKKLKRLVAEAREEVAEECKAAKAVFINEQIEKIVAHGVERDAAQRMAEAWTRGVLTPGAMLYFDNLGAVTVADILADPARFDGETLADPIQQFEDGYGPNCAIFFLREDGSPWISSFAHGGCDYEIKHYCLPVIELQPGEIERTVDQAESALIAARRGLYQRDGLIVSASEVKVITADEREILAQRIEERGEHALVEDLSAAADFQRWNDLKKKFVKTNCTKDIAKTLQDRRLRLRLPILMGVINAPTLRADGSILDKPGYDERTGLLFDPRGTSFPSIPERLTLKEAKDALERLLEPIAKFPFKSDVDKAVALSSMLTACVRRTLRAAPLHGYTAPVPGSGKSNLVDIASILATGQEAGVTAQGNTEEEFEKRLSSALLEGAAIIAIDNCERPVGGAFLNQVCTQRTVKPRILGLSKTPTVTANAFITATGNNLVFYGDMTRRALLCRLDAGVERPELREFDFDPIETTKRYRPEYVAAALTILRAFYIAGRPQQATPLGSFTEWSSVVRDALIWLGCDDPVDSMEIIRSKDPARNALQAVITQWLKAFSTDIVSVAKLIEKAEGTPETKDKVFGSVIEPGAPADPELKEALIEVAGSGGKISGKRLAGWLGRNQDKIVNGHLIIQWQDATASGRSSWRLAKAGRVPEAVEPEPGWNGAGEEDEF